MTRKTISDAVTNISTEYIEKAADYTVAKKARKPVWVKWATMAACLCLVVVGALTIPNLQNEPQQGQGNNIQDGDNNIPVRGGNPNAYETQQGNEVENTQPARTNLLVVNEVENVMTADMDVQFSHYNDISTLERETVLKEFETIIGLSYDDFIAKISDTNVIKSFYSVDAPADAARTEYIPHDYVFEYQTENDGEIKIAICSAEEPLRDYFIECDNPKQSEINGVSVMIFNYKGSFIVEFSNGNVNYDLETSNITIEDLEDLLVGIMN